MAENDARDEDRTGEGRTNPVAPGEEIVNTLRAVAPEFVPSI